MASPLTRPVKRKVASIRFGDLVVTLAPEGLYLRQARHRTSYLIPYGVAFQRAVSLHVQRERADKQPTSRRRK